MISRSRPLLNTALVLAAFALVGIGLVSRVQTGTAERIAASQRQTLLRTLAALVPPEDYDNDLLADVLEVRDTALGTANPVPVWRARKQGRPAALVIAASAADGYNGEIRLLVAVRADGSLGGVRVVSHHETPGLGDAIEIEKSGWIKRFDGLSLERPPLRLWRVKRDGGTFDQFAGATVTPRAVVNAVKNVLLYATAHRDELFEPTSAGGRG